MYNKKTLIKTLYRLYEKDVLELQIKDFFLIVKDNILPWIEYQGNVLFLTAPLSISLNKFRTDFCANWMAKDERKRTLPGRAIQFQDKELIKIRNHIKDNFGKYRVTGNTWFADWDMAYSYVSRSHLREVTQTQEERGQMNIMMKNNVLYIDTRAVSEVLKISHSYLLKIIASNINSFTKLGHLNIKEETGDVRRKNPYLLNEDQCYLLGMLMTNSQNNLKYKIWASSQFSRARSISQKYSNHLDTEEVIHKELLELTHYTNINAYSEYPLPLQVSQKNGLYKTSIKRIDIFLDKKVAIELKRGKITVDIVTSIIGNKGYFYSLQNVPTFKYMILSSPAGIDDPAKQMLSVMAPKVIFMYPCQIGQKIAQQVLNFYPVRSHWWVKKVLFPKFPNILTDTFLQSLESSDEELSYQFSFL